MSTDKEKNGKRALLDLQQVGITLDFPEETEGLFARDRALRGINDHFEECPRWTGEYPLCYKYVNAKNDGWAINPYECHYEYSTHGHRLALRFKTNALTNTRFGLTDKGLLNREKIDQMVGLQTRQGKREQNFIPENTYNKALTFDLVRTANIEEGMRLIHETLYRLWGFFLKDREALYDYLEPTTIHVSFIRNEACIDTKCNSHGELLKLREKLIGGLRTLYQTRDKRLFIYEIPSEQTTNLGTYIVRNNKSALANDSCVDNNGRLISPYDKQGSIYAKTEHILRFENSNNFINPRYKTKRFYIPKEFTANLSEYACDMQPAREYYEKILAEVEQDYIDALSIPLPNSQENVEQ